MWSKTEVVIVGGGVIGCSVAYHLGKLGVPSLIIERDAIASQASGKAWAVISAPASIVLFWEGSRVPEGSMWPSFPLFEEGLRRFPQLAQESKAEGGIDIHYIDLPAIRVVSEEDEEKPVCIRIKIFGIGRVGAIITNKAGENLTYIDWNISFAKTGLLIGPIFGFNVQHNCTIDELEDGESQTVYTGPMFLKGSIGFLKFGRGNGKITVTVNGEDYSKEFSGLVLGKLVLITQQ